MTVHGSVQKRPSLQLNRHIAAKLRSILTSWNVQSQGSCTQQVELRAASSSTKLTRKRSIQHAGSRRSRTYTQGFQVSSAGGVLKQSEPLF